MELTTTWRSMTRSSLGGPQAGGLASSISFIVCFRLLEAACLTLCLYLDTVAFADSCMVSSFCIRALKAPGL
jgi:hypothetical protein